MLKRLEEDNFDNIADFLLNNCLLKTSTQTFIIREIEFYLTTEKHPDPYTHKSIEQSGCGGWYFHKKGDSYKEGTFKGLDITFSKEGYGGILIRSIQNYFDDKFIEGPCNVVNTLINKEKVCDAVKNFKDLNNVELKDNLFYLDESESRQDKIFTCKRVGLRHKKEDTEEWITKSYRFTTTPHKLKKDVNGIIKGMNLSIPEIKDIMTEGGKRRRKLNF